MMNYCTIDNVEYRIALNGQSQHHSSVRKHYTKRATFFSVSYRPSPHPPSVTPLTLGSEECGLDIQIGSVSDEGFPDWAIVLITIALLLVLLGSAAAVFYLHMGRQQNVRN